MFRFALLMLATLCCCECVNVYSSFWAPIFNPRILNYRVDSKFEPDGGKNHRAQFEESYGYRGENLIADLGNGRRPSDRSLDTDHNYGDVKFYYTYPNANENGLQSINY